MVDQSNSSKDYWDNYYRDFNYEVPTNFAIFIDNNYLTPKSRIVELGCGNGRDAIYFVNNKYEYTGVDSSIEAISSTRKRIDKYCDSKNANLVINDFSELDFSIFNQDNLLIYSRFTLHSIDKKQEIKLFQNLRKGLPSGALIAIETRTIFDELYGTGILVEDNAYVTDHFRRFIDPLKLREVLNLDFDILHEELNVNLAIHGNENPKVLRVIARKR